MESFDSKSHNRAAWDRLAAQGHRFARPADDSQFADPLGSTDGPGWMGGDIAGKRVLCLAAGGGKHGPLFASAGATVTVVDISPAMLAIDQQIARERKLNLRLIETSMDDLSALGDQLFDFVIHPVSSCYIPDLRPMFREIARVTATGGVYISQHKQPISLQTTLVPQRGGRYEIESQYRSTGPLPDAPAGNLVREPGTREHIHTLEQVLGGMCNAGFEILNIIEPDHADADAKPGTFGHRCRYVPPYLRVKARRTEQAVTSGRLWIPDDRSE